MRPLLVALGLALGIWSCGGPVNVSAGPTGCTCGTQYMVSTSACCSDNCTKDSDGKACPSLPGTGGTFTLSPILSNTSTASNATDQNASKLNGKGSKLNETPGTSSADSAVLGVPTAAGPAGPTVQAPTSGAGVNGAGSVAGTASSGGGSSGSGAGYGAPAVGSAQPDPNAGLRQNSAADAQGAASPNSATYGKGRGGGENFGFAGTLAGLFGMGKDNAGPGTAPLDFGGRAPASTMRGADPADYFDRSKADDNLFKIVERRYTQTQYNWIREQLK